MSTAERALGGPEIEVVAKATRRRFTLDYKRRIVREADGCKAPGAIGALLRREGLYSSHLTTWRAARERGDLGGTTAKKRGPLARIPDARDKQIAELERENTLWRKRAERAEALVEVQKTSRRCWGRRRTPRGSDGDCDRGGTPPRDRPDMRSARLVASDLLPPATAPECPAPAPRNLSMRMRQSVAECSVGAPPRSLGAWVG